MNLAPYFQIRQVEIPGDDDNPYKVIFTLATTKRFRNLEPSLKLIIAEEHIEVLQSLIEEITSTGECKSFAEWALPKKNGW